MKIEQDLSTILKEISITELPPGLHGKIMRKLIFLKFRFPFISIMALLTINLVISWLRLADQWGEFDVFLVISIISENIELTGRGLLDTAARLYDVLPLGLIGIFVLNLAIVIYVAYLPIAFSRLKSTAQNRA